MEEVDVDEGLEAGNLTEGIMMGGAMRAAAVPGFAAATSRLLSITSVMRLRVELRAVDMMTRSRSLVLFFATCLALGGFVMLIVSLCLRYYYTKP